MPMFDDPLDTAIDEVARTMTDGAPDASFAAGVLTRLDTQRPRAFAFGWRAALVGFFAIAVVAVALRWSRPDENVATVVVERATTSPTPAAPPRRVSRASDHPPLDRQVTRQRTVPPADLPAATILTSAPPMIAVAPMNVEPLTVAPMGRPDSIEPSALEPVAAIAVTPLGDEPARRFP